MQLGVMDDNTESCAYTINDLSTHPKFNFLKTLAYEKDNRFSFFSPDDNDSPYDCTNIDCSYVSATDCSAFKSGDLNILSLNVQSLSAKFVELKDMLASLCLRNCSPDIICLQELWQFPEDADFHIMGYNKLLFKIRSEAQGGGVGIFVKEDLIAVVDPVVSVFHERILETIFIELTLPDKKKLIIGSVYRPGSRHPTLNSIEQYDISMDLLAGLLENLSSKNLPSYIFGDINLDALKYGNCNKVTNYIDLLFSNGFRQIVTLPTRCGTNSASIIDHCITNSTSFSHKTQILTTLLSDNFPIISTITYYLITNHSLNTLNRKIFQM